MTRIDGTGLSPIQNSISSVLDTLTAGTSQANKTPATVINRALDSFQAVNFEARQLSLAQLNALPAVSNAASFADPASFYKAQESNSAVFQELKRKEAELEGQIKELANQIEQIQQGSQQQFSDFKIFQRSLAVDNSSPSVRIAFNEAVLSFQGAIDLQLQFDSQKLFSQRFSSIRA